MFDFFKKKNFLVDYLEGFIDIHNHILPGIDDGSKNVDESIELIQGFGEIGVTDFIATPHIMNNYYPNDPKSIKDALIVVKNELIQHKLKDVSIRAAAEHMIDDNFEAILERDEIMPLGGNYLLVEMSYLQASINFEEALEKIRQKGYFTILAHPERYLYLHSKMGSHKAYKKQGVLYQLNLLSLSKYYGKEVQQMAMKLLSKGLIDFAATDVHNKRQLNSLKEVQVDTKTLELLKPILLKTNNSF
ncbi:CpsB/CapC family capsule biosynthesis tyrosine phosphatase [Maribacter sp. TH_r10]|uniref:tyrosine-protein phosphatase n=1 Tax=Maribacter sp. TH_r10 TaxID=3082086 RepID=UPI002953566A|nr:CpsB/CapC family capsule biosynthesis tyrosine phosphatase [Maribacter sp. TH_r10]MDV7140135.1 CpsB/CapC family capsule biosynthesis tyrosine phosphatase [Maribacter sp. TH_r10]